MDDRDRHFTGGMLSGYGLNGRFSEKDGCGSRSLFLWVDAA